MLARVLPLAAAGFALACASGEPRLQTGPGAEVSHDGLHRLENTSFDRAWARPGLDLSPYQRVLLVSDGIHYKRRPPRSRPGDFALEPLEQEQLAAELRAALLRALFDDGSWKIAEVPGSEVLLLRVALIDVVVTAPPEPISSRARVYIESVGTATLVIELYDSVTREVLARVADRSEFESSTGVVRSTAITNRAQVRRTFEAWAFRLRQALDKIRSLRLPEAISLLQPGGRNA